MTSALENFFDTLSSKLEDLVDRRASLKGILYGNSGTGKTTAAMQLLQTITPAGKDIIFIDSAEGWVSLNNFSALKQRTRRWTDIRGSVLEKIAEAIATKSKPFDNVGAVLIDEHSSIYDHDLAAVTRANASKDPTKDPDTPKWPDMNTAKNRTLNLIGKFIRLDDVHVILIAHERVDSDDLQRQVISPSYTPKTGSGIRELVHLVGRVTADEKTSPEGKVEYFRQVQVQPTSRVVAKTRIGGFSGVRVSMKELVSAIKEWLDGDRESVDTQEIVEEVVTAKTEPSDQMMELLEGIE